MRSYIKYKAAIIPDSAQVEHVEFQNPRMFQSFCQNNISLAQTVVFQNNVTTNSLSQLIIYFKNSIVSTTLMVICYNQYYPLDLNQNRKMLCTNNDETWHLYAEHDKTSLFR